MSGTPTLWQRASGTDDSPSSTCTTAVPGKHGYVPANSCNAYYNYNPETAPAVAVSIIFAILTISHIVLAVMHRKKYPWVLIMGSAWETIAFIAHSLGTRDQQSGVFATVWSLLFLLAPLWINGFVYMTFARVVNFYMPGKQVWIFKSHRLSLFFVLADVASFIVQAAGGVMINPGSDQDVIKIGLNVYLAGLGVQMFFILIFIGLMIMFHRDAPLGGTVVGKEGYAMGKRNWKPLMMALYTALAAIVARIIFRICEFAGGIKPSNPLPFNEEYAYVLDAFPMMMAILILAVIHPGRFLQGPDSSFPRKSRAEKKAAKQAKKDAKAMKKGKSLSDDSVNLGNVQPTYDQVHSSRHAGHSERGYTNGGWAEAGRGRRH